MVGHAKVLALVGIVLLLAACSASPQTVATSTTRTTPTTISKIPPDEDGCRNALNYADAHPRVPDVDSVVAASCSPAALKAALSARDPSLSSQQVTTKEQETATTVCRGNANLALCAGKT